ncbi:hypothetical protein [Methylobacterium soli]|uniref:Uncharacterized protein n=1 Tax=Methylobacterium soli TaxID=553447 RepID=A0A6L3T1L9_9HYPH|nr:hypothetical protein [Methylobacterium soli]KAB1078722.1 hypothetical protein F6X53_13635 [Methylobacterium soli]GJE44286.1 hypothetical protein AEGHOMDF_3474 [Methylobacterium soli]
MYFLVSATDTARSIAFERSSMTDALDKALALLGSGLADVTVTHPSGLRHTTSEFLAAYLSAQDMRRPDGTKPAIVGPLAA